MTAMTAPVSTPQYACGYRTGVFADTTRPNWDGTGPRPLAWSAWYPVAMPGDRLMLISHGLFDLGPVCLDQPVAGEGCMHAVPTAFPWRWVECGRRKSPRLRAVDRW